MAPTQYYVQLRVGLPHITKTPTLTNSIFGADFCETNRHVT